MDKKDWDKLLRILENQNKILKNQNDILSDLVHCCAMMQNRVKQLESVHTNPEDSIRDEA